MPTTASIESRHRATALRGWRQRVAHIVVLVAGWGLFAWGWRKVLASTWDTDALVLLIIGSLLLLPTLTIFWILHNKRIYRIKGPRSGVPSVDFTYAQDWNGRQVVGDWQQLAGADLIVIDVDDDRKIYRPARVGVGQPGSERPVHVDRAAGTDAAAASAPEAAFAPTADGDRRVA